VNDSRGVRSESGRLVPPVYHHHRVLKILPLIPVLSQINPLLSLTHCISLISHACYMLYPLNLT